jgi:hypothetical protein
MAFDRGKKKEKKKKGFRKCEQVRSRLCSSTLNGWVSLKFPAVSSFTAGKPVDRL